jgi:hypothetical protein
VPASPLQGSPVVRHTPAHAPPRCGPQICEYCRPSVAPQPLLGLGAAPDDSFRAAVGVCTACSHRGDRRRRSAIIMLLLTTASLLVPGVCAVATPRWVLPSSTEEQPVAVSLTHSLIKLRPHAAVPAGATIRRISAARNEYTSFQVAVAVPVGGVRAQIEGIDVSFPGVADDSSAVLVHREHYINISVVSNCAGSLGRWPDALIPAKDVYDQQSRTAFPVPVLPGENQAFWVDIFVKNGSTPGTHNGKVTVRWAGNRPPTALPLSLKVHQFTLPSISRYQTTYNCNPKGIAAGRMGKATPTREQKVKWQKQYVDLGLMHRVTFSDFLKADEVALGAPVPPSKATDIDWTSVLASWGKYLGSDGAGLVDTPFGIGATRPTTIQLPAMHYPGPFVDTPINRTLIDRLWHATGCTKATPEWGYAYWSSQEDYGVSDMLQYCDHCAEGLWDPWAKGCCDHQGEKIVCNKQHAPKVKRGPHNNSLAIRFWKEVAAHSKKGGWWSRIFDYTCDEPGADPSRYVACRAHAETIHSADQDYKVMITAEKKSADSVNISSLIDIWVPIINFIDKPQACQYGSKVPPGNTRDEYSGLVATGKGLWWYQSCMSEGCAHAVQPAHGSSAPGCSTEHVCTSGAQANVTWPSYMIDAPATFNRVMSWMSYKYQIQGELYWGTNAADESYSTDPKNSSWEVQWLAGGNGDGSLTYPGRPDKIGGSSTIPIASLRLKQIRDGLQDLEYMYLLEDATGSRTAAAAIVDSVVRTTYDFEHDADAMLAARAKLAAAIEAAMK